MTPTVEGGLDIKAGLGLQFGYCLMVIHITLTSTTTLSVNRSHGVHIHIPIQNGLGDYLLT